MKSQQERANELITKGNELRSQGRLDPAIDAYREAIRLIPAYESLNLVLADMLFERKEFKEAGEAYRKTLEFAPEQEKAWAGLGQCQMVLEQHDAAFESFTRALAINPQNGESNYYLAMLHVLKGERKKAGDHLARALREKPSWEENAREDPLLKALFDESKSLAARDGEKKWWQFWKRAGR